MGCYQKDIHARGLTMSNGQKLVTVLVPSYNHGKYITERIESIINQCYKNFELIVIDDCSTDDSNVILNELHEKYKFKYIRRDMNSGTPFAAWKDICTLAKGEYIWICESDDVAEPVFLETAVKSLADNQEAVIFYSNSYIINENSEKIGHTQDYFHNIWKEKRWDEDFCVDGLSELVNYQLRGQTVPNMSSALFRKDAFTKSFTSFIQRLRLTGDWLFIGDVMKHGYVAFSHQALNCFREHEVTSRVRVKSARSQAEFILTKFRLFRGSQQKISSFAPLMSTDVIRFLYEPAGWFDVLKAMLQVSWIDTLKFTFLFAISAFQHPEYFNKFKERYKHAKTMGNT